MAALSAAGAAKILGLRFSSCKPASKFVSLKRYLLLRLLADAEAELGRPVHPVELGYRMAKLTGQGPRPGNGRKESYGRVITQWATNKYSYAIHVLRWVARTHVLHSKRCTRYYLTSLGKLWMKTYATQRENKK